MKWLGGLFGSRNKTGDETRVADEASDKTVVQNTAQSTETQKKAEGDAALAAGTAIGSYQIERVLGEGGMGRVYLVTQGETRYALKVLASGASEPDVERVKREIAIGESVSHPNVCRLQGSGQHEKLLYLVMEYVEGQTLKELIGPDPPFDVTRAVALLRQLLSALEALHAAGVVHRDLKPGNIMVRADGSLMVMDFGISKIASDSSLTRTGLALGTPTFIAPEQIVDAKRVGPPADLVRLSPNPCHARGLDRPAIHDRGAVTAGHDCDDENQHDQNAHAQKDPGRGVGAGLVTRRRLDDRGRRAVRCIRARHHRGRVGARQYRRRIGAGQKRGRVGPGQIRGRAGGWHAGTRTRYGGLGALGEGRPTAEHQNEDKGQRAGQSRQSFHRNFPFTLQPRHSQLHGDRSAAKKNRAFA